MFRFQPHEPHRPGLVNSAKVKVTDITAANRIGVRVSKLLVSSVVSVCVHRLPTQNTRTH